MRIIGHIDVDAFFAAVEERDRPWLAGRPIVVGADPQDGKGRGVVSTANYKAREFGIGSAMPIARAWKAAEEARTTGEPRTVFLRGSHGKYGKISKQIMQVVRDYAPVVEQASVDEAYFDLSHTASWKRAREAVRRM
jgi:nucleotidyltransferase/DNA polymerase involved in DNA repair